MPTDLSETLHRAAATPRHPLDLELVLEHGHRRRRIRRAGAVAGSFLVIAGISAAVVLAVPDRAPDQPVGTPNPVRLADLPVGWSELPAPPAGRRYAATAWTGERLIIWGGAEAEAGSFDGRTRGNGYVLDADTGVWREMAASPLAARSLPATAWTGEELLVWGGTTNGDGRYDDGAAYDPVTDAWRPLPPAPITARAPQSVWTGRELIVWGTAVREADVPTDGAAYNPATDTWRPIAAGPIELTDATAAWTGAEMIVFGAALHGGNIATTRTAVGAAYDPYTDSWRHLPESDLSPQASTVAWTGDELIAWDYGIEAAAYDPANDAWRPLADPPIEPGECSPASVSIGRYVFGEYCGAMALYDGATDRWNSVAIPEFAGWGRDPNARAWWFELVPADPAVILFGWVENRAAMLAYRPAPAD